MSQLRAPQAVADATGCDAQAVAAVLPPLYEALNTYGILWPRVVVAALATIAVECDFIPQAESSDGKAYEGRVDLGNTQPGDGVRYIGRGLPQLTGRHNYEQYGEWCGYDLVNHPELLDDLAVSCAVFACFFKCSRCAELANEGFWQAVRRTYNGGSNGMARFIQCVGALLPLAEFAYKGEV